MDLGKIIAGAGIGAAQGYIGNELKERQTGRDQAEKERLEALLEKRADKLATAKVTADDVANTRKVDAAALAQENKVINQEDAQAHAIALAEANALNKDIISTEKAKRAAAKEKKKAKAKLHRDWLKYEDTPFEPQYDESGVATEKLTEKEYKARYGGEETDTGTESPKGRSLFKNVMGNISQKVKVAANPMKGMESLPSH